jgi:hypothetical protein
MDDPRPSRGQMIRLLDEAATEVEERLGNGPLNEEERSHLLHTLGRLLPAVAEELQDLEGLACGGRPAADKPMRARRRC